MDGFGLGVGLATIFIIVFVHLRLRVKKSIETKWRTITAVVEQNCADQASGRSALGSGVEYVGGILYSYEVNHDFYSGQHNFSRKFGSAEDAISWTKTWIGKKITIRYNPDDPSKSEFMHEFRAHR